MERDSIKIILSLLFEIVLIVLKIARFVALVSSVLSVIQDIIERVILGAMRFALIDFLRMAISLVNLVLQDAFSVRMKKKIHVVSVIVIMLFIMENA